MAFEGRSIWFLTGSQDLYGEVTLRAVHEQSAAIVAGLGEAPDIPVEIVHKPTVTTPDGIRRACLDATADDSCIGVIAWMHTFSPAKMWIAGLQALQKPFLHLHTQFGRDLPYADLDMAFMNLNQSAHGDREFAYIVSRLRHPGKVIAGHWQDPVVQARIGAWARAAAGAHEARTLKVCRFGDNMREVAVTEGDKVEVQARLGTAVNTYPVNELADTVAAVADAEVERPLRRVRRGLRRGGGAAPGRRAARLPARCRAHRAWPARLPGGGRLRRLHGHLPGPRWPQAAAGHRRPAPHGRLATASPARATGRPPRSCASSRS